MRVLTVLLLCCTLLWGGAVRAGMDAAQLLSTGSSVHHAMQIAAAEPCNAHHAMADDAAAHHGKTLPASCHLGGGGHVCCLPPLSFALAVLPSRNAVAARLHAYVPGLQLAERIEVPYRPPAA